MRPLCGCADGGADGAHALVSRLPLLLCRDVAAVGGACGFRAHMWSQESGEEESSGVTVCHCVLAQVWSGAEESSGVTVCHCVLVF